MNFKTLMSSLFLSATLLFISCAPDPSGPSVGFGNPSAAPGFLSPADGNLGTQISDLTQFRYRSENCEALVSGTGNSEALLMSVSCEPPQSGATLVNGAYILSCSEDSACATVVNGNIVEAALAEDLKQIEVYVFHPDGSTLAAEAFAYMEPSLSSLDKQVKGISDISEVVYASNACGATIAGSADSSQLAMNISCLATEASSAIFEGEHLFLCAQEFQCVENLDGGSRYTVALSQNMRHVIVIAYLPNGMTRGSQSFTLDR